MEHINTFEHLPFDPLAASFAIIFHGTPSVFRTVYVLTSWRGFLHWNDACRCYSNMEGTYLAKQWGGYDDPCAYYIILPFGYLT